MATAQGGVLDLEESARATLAGLLIESLDDEPDEDWKDAWAAEIQRRTAQLGSGEVSTIPWEEVPGYPALPSA